MTLLFITLKNSFSQLFAVVILGLFFFGIHKFLKGKKSFVEFLGLVDAGNQFDRTYFGVLAGLVLFGVGTTYLQYNFSDTFRGFLVSESSPYGKILKLSETSLFALLSGFVYCFISAGGSEEILFRGLIAKKMYLWFGKFKGNILQALIFWLMHLLIFRFVTGHWFSWVQVFGFVVSFGLGLLLGYLNFRKNGESIWPSWIAHGVVNYFTFLTLFFLL